VDAYLVETRSWGGESGSPAFFYGEPGRIPPQCPTTLLGVLHGHFDIKKAVKASGGGETTGGGSFTYETTTQIVELNSGIAVVLPAQDLHDLLQRRTSWPNERKRSRRSEGCREGSSADARFLR